MSPKADRLLMVALILAVVIHGSALLYNVDKTYDAFVHIFFADHYARSSFHLGLLMICAVLQLRRQRMLAA